MTGREEGRKKKNSKTTTTTTTTTKSDWNDGLGNEKGDDGLD